MAGVPLSLLMGPGGRTCSWSAAAALLSLNQLSTLDTKVVQGSSAGTVVLVGGGDPTLNSLSGTSQSVYPGAARLDDLVAQIRKNATGPITNVVVDISQFSGATQAQGWSTADIQGGNFTPIQAAMMDGGRLNPTDPDGARTASPAQAVGAQLASRLGLPASAVSFGTAPTGTRVLGVVHSAPIADLVSNLLNISDNVLAEMIGRQVAKADGQPESFSGSVNGVLDVLKRNGFDTTGVSLVDSSGLSTDDQVPAKLLASIIQVAAGNGSDPRTAKLRPLLTGLPVADAPTGTLNSAYNHFDTAASAAGRGWVRAKTGTLSSLGVNTMTGLVLDSDNRVLVFAFMSNGAPAADTSSVAPAALDVMTATLRGCGCR